MQPSSLILQTQTGRVVSLAYSPIDWAVYAFLLVIGAFQLTHYPHSADFSSDVSYPDLARSILEGGSYQIRLLPQTTLPPGLPFILAFAGKFLGLSPAVSFGVIAVSTALGLIAAYELLRRTEGRGIAAIACLLLASSPSLFGFNTDVVFPEMPYLFASMAALLVALKIDQLRRGPRLTFWIMALAAVLVAAILIRSVGIALLVGLISWVGVSLVTAPETGRRRLARFAVPLVFGFGAQLGWSVWTQHHQTLEWKLPGYPESYISQLKVKNGQHPELGYATFSDIPSRIERNLVSRAAGLSRLLFRRNVAEFWSSPAIAGLVAVIGVGLLSSLRNGGQLYDWYFLWYECIFMVWPWDYRDRFVVPVVPLACMYLWRGGRTIHNYWVHQPRSAGITFATVGSFLCICSAAFAFRLTSFSVDPGHARGDHLQTIAAALFWGVLAICGFVLLKLQQEGDATIARAMRVSEPVLQVSFWLVAISAVTFLVSTGVKTIVAVGRDRLNPQIGQESLYPELKASNWIRTNSPSNVVIMAREPEFVFHYTQHPTVWFPPISSSKVLMDGIQRYNVGLVVVAHHQQSYWLPAEDDCFEALEQSYPGVFHLAQQGPDEAVFRVGTSSVH